MKIIAIGLLLPLLGGVAYCQKVTEKSYDYRVLVVDDEGEPVPNADVWMMKYSWIEASSVPVAKPVKVNTPTDDSGIASIAFLSAQTPGGVAVSKEGYYGSTAPANWTFPRDFGLPPQTTSEKPQRRKSKSS